MAGCCLLFVYMSDETCVKQALKLITKQPHIEISHSSGKSFSKGKKNILSSTGKCRIDWWNEGFKKSSGAIYFDECNMASPPF